MSDVTQYLNNDFRAIDSSETLSSVKDFFADGHFTHFPVTENDIYIGSIGADDADTFEDDKQLSHYRYALEGFFARTNMFWLDVLELFAINATNVIPVLDESNKYVGYYEMADIVRLFNETPFLKEQGGIIVVEKGVADYSIGQITQIVESNNGKILGLFISESTVDTVQVTIKIAIGGINEIIQTFRRYDYEIISEHQEDNYLRNLKDRSDYLDKYLNI
ncbi:CBS domain-containing protein [Flavobacterium silvaticum]|uniref:CBS domain-containing protein n=1 Tax=Flavobacterium silvaticum TaxID=1852020 RepID=A0A972JHS6_9FLAO|nr:acetoin utilization protein acuB [Flavobacterium silvaticum]NMH27448.1 CBS domain-containing protein [Flavobacterium silvaticum]